MGLDRNLDGNLDKKLVKNLNKNLYENLHLFFLSSRPILVQSEKESLHTFHGEKKKPYIRFYFHHNNHDEEPAGIYGENTTYIIYIIFSPYMVNVVYTIHRENKRNRKKIGKKEPCSTQKAFAFVEYGTRRCPSSSDRPVGSLIIFFRIPMKDDHPTIPDGIGMTTHQTAAI